MLLLLMQVALFWQGLRMSHGAEEVLQSRPISYRPEHDRGTKNVGDDSARNRENI